MKRLWMIACFFIPVYPQAQVANGPGSGNAARFNTPHNFLGVADADGATDFTTNQNFTVETWVKIDPVQQDITAPLNNILVKGSGTALPYGIYYENQSTPENGKIIAFQYDGITGTTVISSVATIGDNKWHHIAFGRSGGLSGIFSLYVDGILQGTVADTDGPYANGSEGLFIGGFPAPSSMGDVTQYLTGAVDELRIWDKTLSQLQIRERMCRKITNTDPLFANLKVNFRMDEGAFINYAKNAINNAESYFYLPPSREISAAPIGNASAFNYVATGAPATNLSFPGQDNFAVNLTAGTHSGQAGVHIYRVDEQPNTLDGTVGAAGNNRYFGVFTANITGPQYTAVYNYTDNPLAASAENELALFKRTDNAALSWFNSGAALNTTANTFTVAGENTEYLLGKYCAAIKPTIGAIGTSPLCGDESITLVSSEAASYSWTQQNSTASLAATQNFTVNAGNTPVNQTTAFVVTTTDVAGCVSVPSDPFMVTIFSSPETPTVTVDGNTANVCPGKTVTLTSSVASGYLWSTGAVTQSIVVSQPGSYSVIITNANGCASNSSIPVVVTYRSCAKPTGLITGNITTTAVKLTWTAVACAVGYQYEYKVKGSGPYTVAQQAGVSKTIIGLLPNTTYQWRVIAGCKITPDTIASPGFTNGPEFTTLAAAFAGNDRDSQAELKVVLGSITLSATIYPNPANSSTTVNLANTKGQVQAMLTDLSGKQLWQSAKTTGSMITIDLSRLAKGTYIVIVKDDIHSTTLKLIKE